MTWDLRDSAAIATISGGSEPPTDIKEVLDHEAWAHVFAVWANDRAQTGVDGTTRVWYQFYADCKKSLEYDELETKYFSDSATEPLPYSQMLRHMWNQRHTTPYVIQNQLAEIAAQQLDNDDLWFDFSQDVRDAATTAASDPQAVEEAKFQAATVSDPQAVTLTRDRIDQAVVDSFNQDALKTLAEGSSIDFWMRDDLLLIGNNQPKPFVEFAKNGGNKGTLKMKAKGGAFSSGEVVVQQEAWLDLAALKEAIRRFSQKKVTVGDVS